LSGLWKCWSDPTANADFYPMTYSSWWIEYKIWGINAAGHHLVNMILHGCNAAILYAILRLLNVRFAWFIAAIFAVHPIQVGSVVWISERKNTLSGLLYLTVAWMFLRFWMARNAVGAGLLNQTRDSDARNQVPGAAGAWRWYVLALFFFLLAMLAKPLVMTFAAGVLVVMWWKRGGRLTRRDVELTLPFFALTVPVAIVTMWVQKHHVIAAGDEFNYSFIERMLIAGRVFWFYIYKLFLPERLSFAYPLWNINSGVWWQWLLPLAALAAIVAAWVIRRRLGVGLFAAFAFFIVTLSPALGFINVYWHRYYFVANHMLYLAMIAQVMVVTHFVGGWLVGRMGESKKHVVGLVGAGVITACVVWSIVQSMAYENPEKIWRDSIAKYEDSWIAHNNLGGILTPRGDLAQAREHYLKAFELAPRAPEVFKNLLDVLMTMGRFSEAADVARRRLVYYPDDPNTLEFIGESLARAGNLPAAAEAYKTAVDRINAGLAAGKPTGKLAEAEWRFRLGQSLLGLGRIGEAVEALRASVALAPLEGESSYLLSLALLRADRVPEAAAELRRLVRMEDTPADRNPEHLARYALVCAASRAPGVEDLAEALRAAELACSLGGRRIERSVEVLAIVDQARGETVRAAELIAKAERLAQGAGYTALAERMSVTAAVLARGERVWLSGPELAVQ
jgi:tetratricopeptide (TPR) repeat protein